MEIVTLAQLKGITDKSEQVLKPFVSGLNDTLHQFQIEKPLRIQHFLAQILHESGCFTFRSENLNYSASRLVEIFPKYFNVDTALQYARQPQKIANRVYANRMGNGDEASGEGWKFRGRSAMQITGRENFNLLSIDTNIDFVSNPDLLTMDSYYFMGAGWFWRKKGLNSLADKDDLSGIRKKVNGGFNGLDDCKKYLEKAKKFIK